MGPGGPRKLSALAFSKMREMFAAEAPNIQCPNALYLGKSSNIPTCQELLYLGDICDDSSQLQEVTQARWALETDMVILSCLQSCRFISKS